MQQYHEINPYLPRPVIAQNASLPLQLLLASLRLVWLLLPILPRLTISMANNIAIDAANANTDTTTSCFVESPSLHADRTQAAS